MKIVTFLTALSSLSLIACNSGPAADEHFAPIAEGAVDSQSAGVIYDQYLDTLPKIAEIIRRNENCKRLENLDIASKRSIPVEPVFIARCKSASGDPTFLSMSLSEAREVAEPLGLTI